MVTINAIDHDILTDQDSLSYSVMSSDESLVTVNIVASGSIEEAYLHISGF